MAIGIFGFAIREFAIAAPLAVLLCAWRSDQRRRRQYLLVGIGELALCALIYWWTAHISGSVIKHPQRPTLSSVVWTGQAYFTLAFFVCPAVALSAARRLKVLSKWSL